MANIALGKLFEEHPKNEKCVTDGDTSYDWQKGYCDFAWPANLTLDLEAVYNVTCIRFLLHAMDDRRYKYRLLTSRDHRSWDVLYETPVDGAKGWQSFRLEKPLECRYVRLHCLHNTANPGFHVVELEVWDSQPSRLADAVMFDQAIANLSAAEVEKAGAALEITQEFKHLHSELQRIAAGNTLLNSEPLRQLVDRLAAYAQDVGRIESSMDAIKRHITDPVVKKLHIHTWIGIIGGALAIVTLLLELIWHLRNAQVPGP